MDHLGHAAQIGGGSGQLGDRLTRGDVDTGGGDVVTGGLHRLDGLGQDVVVEVGEQHAPAGALAAADRLADASSANDDDDLFELDGRVTAGDVLNGGHECFLRAR